MLNPQTAKMPATHSASIYASGQDGSFQTRVEYSAVSRQTNPICEVQITSSFGFESYRRSHGLAFNFDFMLSRFRLMLRSRCDV
jgi:hypothetical protein